jgi:hypothetical protein
MSRVFMIVVTYNPLLALNPKFRSYTDFNFNVFLPFFLGLCSCRDLVFLFSSFTCAVFVTEH